MPICLTEYVTTSRKHEKQTIQHDINGEALLSQIATLPEARGRGNASRLVKAVCAELSESEVFLLCEDALLPFYRRLGFKKAAVKLVLTRS